VLNTVQIQPMPAGFWLRPQPGWRRAAL